MGKLKASAAFYILALAAQVSGYTSPGLAIALATFATGLLAWSAWGYRQPFLDFFRTWRLRA